MTAYPQFPDADGKAGEIAARIKERMRGAHVREGGQVKLHGKLEDANGLLVTLKCGR
jgi:hypothetical protein